MSVAIQLSIPLLCAALALLFWAVFRLQGWHRFFSKFVFGCSLSGAAIYVVGTAASLMGDQIHRPADSLAWSPVYAITLPLVLGGWWLSLLALLAAVSGAIAVPFLKKRK